MRNSKTGIRGVYWNKYNGKWAAQVKLNGRNKHCGYFDSIEEAEKAVREGRKKYMPYSIENRA